jgi:hypothetical protein
MSLQAGSPIPRLTPKTFKFRAISAELIGIISSADPISERLLGLRLILLRVTLKPTADPPIGNQSTVAEILQKLRRRLDASHEQMIPGSRTCHVQ